MVELLSLLAAAVVAVVLFNRLGLGSILGYLAAGALVGPSGLALVSDPVSMRHIGELGVVFLLFLIGIEIKPQRLWVMRRFVFGMGGLQVVITGFLLAAAAYYGLGPVLGLDAGAALVIGFGLALSSTAFGVQILSERNQMTSHWGRSSFSILLFQDLAVVPLMMAVPLLAVGGMDLPQTSVTEVLQAAAIFIAAVVGGRFAINPLLHLIARTRSNEVLVAAALLLVLGFGWIMEQVGLSMAMGAFIAGVLLAESEYRHQIEADVLPFRGLLLGLFFMSVGMALDPAAITANLGLVIGGTVALLAIKAVLAGGLTLLWRLPLSVAVRTGFLLSQAGEFGFVLFSLADGEGLLPAGLMEPLISVVVLSMAATPVMVRVGDGLGRRFGADATDAVTSPEAEEEHPVIIAGFGRVGRTVAGMLAAAKVPFVAIDMDADHVADGRRRGYTVYFGDVSRPEVLRAIGAAHARLMVVTVDNPHAAEGILRTTRRHYPGVPVHARARDWDAADRFTALGAEHAIPETVEASLRLGAAALQAAGVDEDERQALFDDLRAENFLKTRN